MQIVGIDLGTTNIKTSSERCFPSGISQQIYPNSNILEFENQKYTVELYNSKSTLDININKSLNKNVKLNFLYALYLESQYEENYFEEVLVGLPCSQWKSNSTVEQFKESLSIPKSTEVKVNGYTKLITVDKITVIPEGSTAYYSSDINNVRFRREKVLVVDWGGRTLNSLLFQNDNLIDTHTEELGVLSIYPEMSEKISTETGISIKPEDMNDILKSGLSYKGKVINVEQFIESIAYNFCYNIYKSLQLRWNVDTIKHVLMIGGGSINMTKYIQKYIPHAELQPNAQTITAIGMGEMAGIL